jgi:hypothetical protein
MERVKPSFANYRLLFEMLDREPATDAAARASVAGFEHHWGLRLPRSLREWFSFSAETVRPPCYPLPLAEMSSWPPEGSELDQLPRKMCLGQHDGDIFYYVPLDEGDDPPVLLESPVVLLDTGGDFSETFSEAAVFWSNQRLRCPYWSAAGGRFHPPAWDYLHERFRVLESTRGPAGGHITFVVRGAGLNVSWEKGDPRSGAVPAHWVVSGLTEPAFLVLVDAVSPWVDFVHPTESHRSPLAGGALRRHPC